MKNFKLDSKATKQVIIDKYNELLQVQKKTVYEAEQIRKQLKEAEKHLDERSVEDTESTTVEAVLSGVARLKAQLGGTLNQLTDEMSHQAEHLEKLKRASTVQEQRLKDLFNMETVADGLAKLMAAYDERKELAESEYEIRLQEMEQTFSEREKILLTEIKEKQDALNKEISKQQEIWQQEQQKKKQLIAEEDKQRKLQKEREQSEYIYKRNRERKLDQDAYEEKKHALEKELIEKKELMDKEFSAREEKIVIREAEMDRLEQEVLGFNKRLAQEIAAAEKRVSDTLKSQAKHSAELVALERDWEKRVLEQKIEHLEQTVSNLEKKISELNKDLHMAQTQVNEVAKKAIEGASLNKAFQSVNTIALEQARTPDNSDSLKV